MYSYTLSKSKPLISSSALKHSQTLPVPGVPPPWTTKMKLNKEGSIRLQSRKISCLLITLIFGGGQQLKKPSCGVGDARFCFLALQTRTEQGKRRKIQATFGWQMPSEGLFTTLLKRKNHFTSSPCGLPCSSSPIKNS